MAETLRNKAKQVNGGSKVITGKDKLKTTEVIALYPNGLTINAVDMVQGETGKYPVFNFVEDATKWFAGGAAATNVVEAWLEDYTLQQINESLATDPIKVKIAMDKTKKGRDYARFDVL